MGGSCSTSRPNETESRLVYGEDENYRGDQSYRNYHDPHSWMIYDSEFSPEKPKVQLRVKEDRTESKKTVKEKLENIRQSWFNPERFEQEEFYEPKKKDADSKGTVKDKLTTWRRSWFGPTDSPQLQERKLSVADTNKLRDEPKDLGNSVIYRDSRSRLSQSGMNRLSVTRSFVQRLGQADEVYGKTSKSGTPRSPSGARKMSTDDCKTDTANETAPHSDRLVVEAEADLKKETDISSSSTADVLLQVEEIAATENKTKEKDEESNHATEPERGSCIRATPTVSIEKPEDEDEIDKDHGSEEEHESEDKHESEDSHESEDDHESEAEPTEPKKSTVRITTVVSAPRLADRPRVYRGASRYSTTKQERTVKSDSNEEKRKSNDYQKLQNDSTDSD